MAIQDPDVEIISLHERQSPAGYSGGLSHRVNHSTLRESAGAATEPPGQHDVLDETQRWDLPRVNILRVFATFWCFLLLGANDSLYGAIIPYLETYYNIAYIKVSLLFISPVSGFIVSTLCNHSIHSHFGQRGIALIAGSCHVVAYIVASLHPPFPALVVVYILVGLGSGAKQAAWNSFISGLCNSSELLGLLPGFYGTGATIAPALTTFAVTRRGWSWYMIYYILAGMAGLDMVFSLSVFATQNGHAYRERIADTNSQPSVNAQPLPAISARQPAANFLTRSRTFQCLRNHVVLLCSIHLLSYVGCEVALGGWIVTFMRRIRHGGDFQSGMVSSGLWAGITVGRMVLGFVTGRVFKSPKWAVMFYLSAAVAMHLCFWLIPNFMASAIFAAFLGFFLGPIFPCVILCLSNLLPSRMRVSAVGICSAVGASGASIIPFMVGAIAQAKGVAVLQPIVLAFLILCFIIWCFVPNSPKGLWK
ncbi:major facilitator superfamily domain-containing protein [Aspergillus pseudoustus]|uniref:Major facilitator superfamily domain-containing protein n=1 Tax=Aspergillus pseudoustus TaxID=1810923 RepID=A0ABR4JHQ1_9EURO